MSQAKREIADVRKQLLEFGFEGSVILLPGMLPDEEAAEIYARRFVIDRRTPTCWLFKSRNLNALGENPVICTVRRKTSGKLTGTCDTYDKNGVCGHGAQYCRENQLPVPGPYLLARRLEPYQFVHSDGVAGATRRNQARERMRTRTREHFYALCRRLPDPRPRKKSKTGQPRIPWCALVYALQRRCADGLTPDDLRDDLSRDPFYELLTGDRSEYRKSGPASDETLSQIAAGWEYYDLVPSLLKATASLGQLMDKVMGIDASGFGTTKLANWFQKRYASVLKGGEGGAPEEDTDAEDPDDAAAPHRRGRPKAKKPAPGAKRMKKGYVKVHTVEGLMSGLIYALQCTLDFGEGIADTLHFESLVRTTLHGAVRIFVADKGYWNARHFGLLDRLNALLMIMKRDDVDPDAAEYGREMIAFIEYLRLNHPGTYRAFYRYRQRIESAFSAQKRKTGHMRMRTRKSEMKRVNQAYPPSLESVKADLRKPGSLWKTLPRNYKEMREFVCTIVAREAVGRAQVSEAHTMAIAANIRRIVEWEVQTGVQINLASGQPITPIRRIFVPWAV